MFAYHKQKIQHQYTSHTVQHKWDTIDYNWLLDHHCETPLNAWPLFWDTTDRLTVTLRHHWPLDHHPETPLTAWPSLWHTWPLTITLTPLTAWLSLWTPLTACIVVCLSSSWAPSHRWYMLVHVRMLTSHWFVRLDHCCVAEWTGAGLWD